MAYDKVVDSAVLDGYFSDIADAIRDKRGDGTYIEMTPADMPYEIENLPTGGGGLDPDLEALMRGDAGGEVSINLPEYVYAMTIAFGDDRSTIKMNNYDVTGLTITGMRIWGNPSSGAAGNGGLFFQGNAINLQYINLPDCTSMCIVKQNAYANIFQNLEEFKAPKLKEIHGSNRIFGGYNATKLTTFICPLFTAPMFEGMFYNCQVLTLVDIKSPIINAYAFSFCSILESLVLRGTTAAKLNNTNAFNNTPIANGTGYIYVPRSLISTYEAATNWSTYAGQFRALEDYTDDGTINGEFMPPAN